VDLFKHVTGWSERMDPRTGKETVYITPYMGHLLTSFYPAFASAIRFERYDDPVDKWLELFGGVVTSKRDIGLLEQRLVARRKGKRAEFEAKKGRIKRRYTNANGIIAQEDYKDYEKEVMEVQRGLEEYLLDWQTQYGQIKSEDLVQ